MTQLKIQYMLMQEGTEEQLEYSLTVSIYASTIKP